MRPSLIVRWVVLACLALVPLRILSTGHLPEDDALRHAAEGASGRAWSDVLVLRPEMTMDSHPGWHALLGAAHRILGGGAPELVVVSVVLLLLLLLLPAVFLLRRPEAWALAVAAFATLEPRLFNRFADGRPFVLHASLLLVLCLLVLRRAPDQAVRLRPLVLITFLLGLAVWMHPSWYLYLLPAGVCLAAGQRRLALLFGAVLASGLLLAGFFYGHPVEFLSQSVRHLLLTMGSPAPPGTLSRELEPGDGSPLLLLGVVAIVLWQLARGRFEPGRLRGPVPLLALAGWLLGWLVIRFWSDWGAVALLAWMAVELQRALEEWIPEEAPRRMLLAAVCGVAALLACSATVRGGRAVERPFLALGAPGAEPMLPDPGGILYSDDMRLFFQLFYSRPQAPFRYMVGFEPGLMPPEDLATFRQITAARTPENFAPWLAKMTPRDRLILRSTEGQPPIPGLEWTQMTRSLWSGRLPRAEGR